MTSSLHSCKPRVTSLFPRAKALLRDYKDLVAYPETIPEVLQARVAYNNLKAFCQDEVPWDDDLVAQAIERLMWLQRQAVLARARVLGKAIVEMWVMESPEMDECMSYLDTLRGRIPEDQIDQQFVGLLDNALSVHKEYQNG